jgi:16S rRNA C1402 N4-methylase RsmH
MKWMARKAIAPGEMELTENPRSRSAQLRVLEKI